MKKINFKVPYDFVIREIYPVKTEIRKLMGAYGLFVNKQLMLFLRDSEKYPEFNGVFVATIPEFFDELQQEIYTSKMEFDLDGSKNCWIFISEDLPDFEQKVAKACELIKQGDERIGKRI